jgi:hypothetical protein
MVTAGLPNEIARSGCALPVRAVVSLDMLDFALVSGRLHLGGLAIPETALGGAPSPLGRSGRRRFVKRPVCGLASAIIGSACSTAKLVSGALAATRSASSSALGTAGLGEYCEKP